MNFNILILAGYSCAGKSTLAKDFSDLSGYGFVEHNKLVHEISESKGFDRARYWLSEVGMKIFIDDTLSEISKRIREFKNLSKNGVITDVAYGNQMINKLREDFPDSKLIVASIVANKELREARMMGRMGGVERESAVNEREFRDGFLIEAGLEEVLKHSDIVVANEGGQKDMLVNFCDKLKAVGIDVK